MPVSDLLIVGAGAKAAASPPGANRTRARRSTPASR